jgi:hypothetical protein
MWFLLLSGADEGYPIHDSCVDRLRTAVEKREELFDGLIALIEIMAIFYLTCQSSNFYDDIRKIYASHEGAHI